MCVLIRMIVAKDVDTIELAIDKCDDELEILTEPLANYSESGLIYAFFEYKNKEVTNGN